MKSEKKNSSQGQVQKGTKSTTGGSSGKGRSKNEGEFENENYGSQAEYQNQNKKEYKNEYQKEYGYAGERDQTTVKKGAKYPEAQNEPKAKLNYTSEKAACKTLNEIRSACERSESPLLCYFDSGAEKSKEIISALKGAGYKRDNVKHTDAMYSTWVKG